MTNKRAKEIFFQNDGQYYPMAHDGFYEEYKSYNVSKETEEKWIKELIKLRLKEFKRTSDFIYLSPLVNYYNKYDLLDELLSVKIKGTHINRLVIIELLTKLLCKNRKKIENYKDKKAVIKNIIAAFAEENLPKKDAEHIRCRLKQVKKKLRIK